MLSKHRNIRFEAGFVDPHDGRESSTDVCQRSLDWEVVYGSRGTNTTMGAQSHVQSHDTGHPW
jgi:hypothetical protein